MANTKNADARVRRTKKMLRAALAKLLEEKGGAADITVKALCEECGINRGTFYLHYRDVNDLLTGIEQELREGFEEELARVPIERLYAGAPAHVLDGVCRFFAQNADAQGSRQGLAIGPGDDNGAIILRQMCEDVRVDLQGDLPWHAGPAAAGLFQYHFTGLAGEAGQRRTYTHNHSPLSLAGASLCSATIWQPTISAMSIWI